MKKDLVYINFRFDFAIVEEYEFLHPDVSQVCQAFTLNLFF